MGETLSRKAVSGMGWNFAGFVARSGANFVIGILLARLLGPQPFGQIAVASIVISLTNLLADAGFAAALVQASDLTSRQIRFAFTVQVLIALGLTSAVGLCAPLMANAFRDPGVRPVLVAMAPIFLIQSFGQTSVALMKRQLAFRRIQTAQVSSYLAAYLLVGLPLALRGAGVWSLVSAQLAQATVFAAAVYAMVRHSVIPCFSRAGVSLLWFGTKSMGSNIVNWGIGNLDNAVAGRWFGSSSLGLYSRAYNLACVPAEGVFGAMQQVLFAAASRAGGNLQSIREAYLGSLAAISLLLFPVFWSLGVCSDLVIPALYGPRWTGAIPVFRPLALAISVHALMALAGPVLSARNRVEWELRAQALTLLVAVPVYVLAVRNSLEWLAWSLLGVYSFRFVCVTAATLRLLQLGWADVVRMTRGATIAGLVTAAAAYASGAIAIRFGVGGAIALSVAATGACLTLLGLLFTLPDRLLASEFVHLLRRASLPLPLLVWQRLDRTLQTQPQSGVAAECR